MKEALLALCLLSQIQAFEYRESSPLSLFPHPVAVADLHQPEAAGNPAALPLLDRTYLCASGGIPYSMEGITSSLLNTGFAKGPFAGRITWSHFGTQHYSENVASAEGGIRAGRFLVFGTGADVYHLSISSGAVRFTTLQADAKIGTLACPTDWLFLAFRQDNVTSLFMRKRRDLLFPSWSAGIGLAPLRGVFLAWNTTRTAFGTINSFSLSANLLRHLVLEAGYARETSTYAAAFQFAYRNLAVSYGIRHHPQLGITHCAGVVLSTASLEVTSMDYRPGGYPPAADPAKKVNINTCTLDDLRSVPELDPLIAERIISYRKIFGPVSRKSLNQIGLEEKEIDRLLDHVYGLAPSQTKGESPRGRGHDLESRKRLFLRLTREGLSPSLAFRVAELADNRNGGDFMKRVEALAGIKESEVKIVRRIWEGSH